jgi:hypothetical protein
MINRKFLWKIVGQFFIILSIVGAIAIQDWLSHLHPVMPEEMFKLLPAIPGYFYCILMLIAGIILLGGWFWQRYPSMIVLYVFSLLSGFIAISWGYFAGNVTMLMTAVSILGICIIIFTCLTILSRKHSDTSSNNNIKAVFVGTTLTVFFILIGGFVFPQWFDAATRNFPDHNLKVAVRDSVGKRFGFITRSDLEIITYIDAWQRGINDLKGIGTCKNLEAFDLADNGSYYTQLRDITPLKDLHHLSKLSLGWNHVLDITPLSELTELTYLDLSNNLELEDIKSLESLTNLSSLYLWGNEIRDLSSLRELTNLNILDLNQNKITDILPLVENTGLGEGDKLNLRSNPLNDISINVYIPQLQKRGLEVLWK